MCSLVTVTHKIIPHFARCPVIWSYEFIILCECRIIVWLADLFPLQMTFLILEGCQNEFVEVKDVFFCHTLLTHLHNIYCQSKGSTTGQGHWSWYCLHCIQLKVNTIWISAHHTIHYINGSFTQSVVGGDMLLRFVSILSWITSTYSCSGAQYENETWHGEESNHQTNKGCRVQGVWYKSKQNKQTKKHHDSEYSFSHPLFMCSCVSWRECWSQGPYD